MMIRSITPADQEQLLLLEEELHDNEGKKHKATLEEALGSKEAISLLAEQAGDMVAYLLATEDQHLKGDLIVLRLAVRPAFQGQGYGSILIAALKDLAVQMEKKAIWIDCPENLLSYFAQQGFRDEAESDRGVHMVWER
ncbi:MULTISPECIES: GNAT family N-acetyltransferase [Streptococcus]|uniref:GNAT family N-acetyltransferase n=1 Tax=Streptococcus TaxID=1301 RepID=UPI00066C7BDB|nr:MULTISPECIES: GNAT family N-acetyltransferase [Streptococcus]MCP9067447.1 GNAT family N-acetyltransferase [Streptococcus parasanguinis]MDN5033129.1 GNAT family N-acetyltransferase [Streptococcus sp. SP8]OHQ89460.1 GNAT family acetyltransferase [Streptococcus sp. HMSC076C09]